jgi:hypothetical protein
MEEQEGRVRAEAAAQAAKHVPSMASQLGTVLHQVGGWVGGAGTGSTGGVECDGCAQCMCVSSQDGWVNCV